MSGFQRGLDLAPTATIDKVALNNKVVLMRAVVRRSKLHLINGLVKKVHKLRDKKGSEAQKKQNNSKADRMLEDIKIIKVLKPDYVSKYALGTTVRFEELAAKASTTSEMRALARLAAHKIIMQEVNKFRQEHEDWKDLAAYLMTKHTSREFKKKKTKEKMKKVEANVIASENLVQNYLGEKLEGRTDLEDDDDVKPDGEVNDDDSDVNDDGNDNDDDDDDDENNKDGGDDNVDDKEADESSNESEEFDERTSENANNLRNVSENKKSVKKNGVNFPRKDDESSKLTKINKNSVKESVGLDEESEDSEIDNGNDDDDDDEIDDVNSDKDCEDEDNDDGDDDSDDNDGETKEKVKNKSQFSEKLKNKKGTKEKNTEKAKSKSKVPKGASVTNIAPKKNVSKEKVEGEMIVKKLNLAKDFVDDDIPKILLSDNEDKIVKHKKKRKDLFFDTGEEYDNSNHDGDENEVSNHGDFGNEFGSGEKEVLEYDNRENYETSIQPTMTAFTTCFVGSLKSSDMMGCDDSQYRSNEDWKRIRHEMKEQKFGSFRGRGQGPPFRGRGSSNNFVSHRGRGFSDGPRGRGFSGGPRGRGHTGRGRGFDGFRGRGGFESNDHTRGGPATKQPGSKKSGGGLHPSWEASKKRKQEQKAVLQAFEGKKIKFDD